MCDYRIHIIVVLFILESACCNSSDSCKKGIIWKNIFSCDYDKLVPPVVDGNSAVVYVKLQIMDVDEIREDSMEFRMHLYITEYWKDPRLNFEVINITKTHTVPVEIVSSMWVPDLVFDNSKWEKSYIYSLPNTAIRVAHDHTITRITRYSFRVSCSMKLQDYPMDIQQCGFKISFLTTSEENGILQWSGHSGSPYRTSGPSVILVKSIQPLKFEMLQPKPYQITEVWTSGNYSTLVTNFTFIRRLTANIFNVYVPSTLVVVLSWLSFWFNPNAVPARVTLGVTSILTLVTQVVQSRSNLPPVSYIKAIDVWLLFCISIITASLVEYALTYNHSHEEMKNEKIDKVAVSPLEKDPTEWAIPSVAEKGRKTPQKELAPSNESNCLKQNTKILLKYFSRKKSTNCFDYYSRLIFPTIFMIFSISYWLHYLGRRKSLLANTSD